MTTVHIATTTSATATRQQILNACAAAHRQIRVAIGGKNIYAGHAAALVAGLRISAEVFHDEPSPLPFTVRYFAWRGTTFVAGWQTSPEEFATAVLDALATLESP